MKLPETFPLERLEITLRRAVVTFVGKLADGTAYKVNLDGGELSIPDLPTLD